jgi:hypothetical protein
MTPAEKHHWWAIVATGDIDLALREFARELREAPEPLDHPAPSPKSEASQ